MPETHRSPPTAAFNGAILAEQNDRFRTSWGSDPTLRGRIVVTHGVAVLGLGPQVRIRLAVRSYDAFDADTDPLGLRDFGAFEINDAGRPVPLYWKIDTYDPDYEWGSEAPHDPSQTARVLTIMLRDEH